MLSVLSTLVDRPRYNLVSQIPVHQCYAIDIGDPICDICGRPIVDPASLVTPEAAHEIAGTRPGLHIESLEPVKGWNGVNQRSWTPGRRREDHAPWVIAFVAVVVAAMALLWPDDWKLAEPRHAWTTSAESR